MKLAQASPISLRHRLTIGMGTMLLPLIVLGAGTLISFEGAIRSFEHSSNETLESLFPLDSLQNRMQQTNTSANACLNYGLLEDCRQYRQLAQEVQQTLQSMINQPAALKEQKPLLLAAQQSWQRAQQQFQRSQTGGVKSNQIREQFNLESQAAMSSLDQLYKLMTQLQLADDLKKADQVKQRVRWIVTTGFSLGLGIAVVSGWLLARSIMRPLKTLEQGVKALGEGNLGHRIYLSREDEFGQLAQTFNLMAGKLEKSQQELTDLATLDGLTGVLNRREFNRRFQMELETAQRYEHSCSLVMFDIDHFKKLNDTHGHQAGDEALKHFAALLKRQVRPGDQVARYGGEEFGIILPQTTAEDAAIMAERLREVIAAEPVHISPQQSLQITSSIGISTYPQDAKTTVTLLEAADQALYAAKRSGRNRVVQASALSGILAAS